MDIMNWQKADTHAVDTYVKEYHGTINGKNKQGYTALHMALFSKASPSVIKMLIDKGAKKNARDDTGLISTVDYAETYCSQQVCDLLNK